MTISKSLFAILSIFLLLSCNSSNDDSDPVAEEMEMEEEVIDEDNNSNPGLVRSIDDGFEIFYEYEGDKLIEISGDDPDRRINHMYTYNNNGNITSRYITGYQDPGMSYEVLYIYEYDTDGRLIRFGDDTHGEYITLTYQNNQVILDYSPSFQRTVELDQAGRIIRYDSDISYRIYSYDSQGNVILAQEYDQETDELINTYQYTYDTYNNPFFGQLQSAYIFSFISTFVSSVQPFSDNFHSLFLHSVNNRTSIRVNDDQPRTITYTYNSNNQFIEAEINDPSDGSIENYTFTYY